MHFLRREETFSFSGETIESLSNCSRTSKSNSNFNKRESSVSFEVIYLNMKDREYYSRMIEQDSQTSIEDIEIDHSHVVEPIEIDYLKEIILAYMTGTDRLVCIR